MTSARGIISKDPGLKRFVILKNTILPIAIIAAVIIADLVFKAVFARVMQEGDTIVVIPKFFELYYTHNSGAAFGMLDGNMTLFYILTPLALIFFCYLLGRSLRGSRFMQCALALVIGGTVGNFVDRVIFQYVRDFFRIVYFGLTIFGDTGFAIFNIADAALVIGVIMLAVYYIFFYRDPKDVRLKIKTRGKILPEESVEQYLARLAELPQPVVSADAAQKDEKRPDA
jgi:signal peptidase II